MKNKFYVSAIYTSPPNTMGGSTKIAIEIIDNLSDIFNFVIFTTEPKTFEKNLKNYSKVKIIPIDFPFKMFNYLSHYAEIKYITKIYKEYFSKNKIDKHDYFLSPSDFAPDVMPIYYLRKEHSFNWIASLFLFIPGPLENIINKYKFPLIKYVIYFVYQRWLFSKMLHKADLFLITNDYDKKYFSNKFKKRIFAIYGGVNPEQINEATKLWDKKKIYDAVFCSRLHPQKGISQLLEVWSMVVKKIPKAKLVVIGNGDKNYENFLKQKAKKLNLTGNIYWMGYVNDVDKYLIYLKSKIFVHGTIYDNNGMVAAEALSTGLPVIMYDLPKLRKVYTEGCIKIKIGDKVMYANMIVRHIRPRRSTNFHISLTLRNKTIQYWSWKNKCAKFYKFLLDSQ